MPHLPRTIAMLVVIAGTLAATSFYALRWRAGRTSGTELLGQVGLTMVLLGGATAVLTGAA